VWPAESTAVTLRLTVPPEATGFGLPFAGLIIVSVCGVAAVVLVKVSLMPPIVSVVFVMVLKDADEV